MTFARPSLTNIHFTSFFEQITPQDRLKSEKDTQIIEESLKKEVHSDQRLHLTAEQTLKLQAMLDENHQVSGNATYPSFEISARTFILLLHHKLKSNGLITWPHQFKFYLIGSRAGSLFVEKQCFDTDLFLECKIKLTKEMIATACSPSQFFFNSTKSMLDYIRDAIEMVIKNHIENLYGDSLNQELTLKEIWNTYFTKKKAENTPVFSLRTQAANRFGIIHIGNTLEIKYCINYEIEECLISGLLHPCTFVQDDLRVDITPFSYFTLQSQSITIHSLENPIHKVLASLEKNELLIERPEASKFIPHLIKFTLQKGITTRDQLEESFLLVIQNMPIHEFCGRLKNKLTEKTQIESLLVICNCYILLINTDKKLPQKELWITSLYELALHHLYDRGKETAQCHSPQFLLNWCSLIFLLTSTKSSCESYIFENHELVQPLIAPKNLLSIFLYLFASSNNIEEWLIFYVSIMPARQLNNPITEALHLIKEIIIFAKKELSIIDFSHLSLALLHKTPSIFQKLEQDLEVKHFKSWLPHIESLELYSLKNAKPLINEKIISLITPLNHQEQSFLIDNNEESLLSNYQEIFDSLQINPQSSHIKESILRFFSNAKMACNPYYTLASIKFYSLYQSHCKDVDSSLILESLLEGTSYLFILKNLGISPIDYLVNTLRIVVINRQDPIFQFFTLNIQYLEFTTIETYLMSLLSFLANNKPVQRYFISIWNHVKELAIFKSQKEVDDKAFLFFKQMWEQPDISKILIDHLNTFSLIGKNSKQSFLFLVVEHYHQEPTFNGLLKIYQELIELDMERNFEGYEKTIIYESIYHFLDKFLLTKPGKIALLKIKDIFRILKQPLTFVTKTKQSSIESIRAHLLHYILHHHQELFGTFFLEALEQELFQTKEALGLISLELSEFLKLSTPQILKIFFSKLIHLSSPTTLLKERISKPILDGFKKILEHAEPKLWLSYFHEYRLLLKVEQLNLIIESLLAPKSIKELETFYDSMMENHRFIQFFQLKEWAKLITVFLNHGINLLESYSTKEPSSKQEEKASLLFLYLLNLLHLQSHSLSINSLLPLPASRLLLFWQENQECTKSSWNKISKQFDNIVNPFKLDAIPQNMITNLLLYISICLKLRSSSIQDKAYDLLLEGFNKQIFVNSDFSIIDLPLNYYFQSKIESKQFCSTIQKAVDNQFFTEITASSYIQYHFNMNLSNFIQNSQEHYEWDASQILLAFTSHKLLLSKLLDSRCDQTPKTVISIIKLDSKCTFAPHAFCDIVLEAYLFLFEHQITSSDINIQELFEKFIFLLPLKPLSYTGYSRLMNSLFTPWCIHFMQPRLHLKKILFPQIIEQMAHPYLSIDNTQLPEMLKINFGIACQSIESLITQVFLEKPLLLSIDHISLKKLLLIYSNSLGSQLAINPEVFRFFVRLINLIRSESQDLVISNELVIGSLSYFLEGFNECYNAYFLPDEQIVIYIIETLNEIVQNESITISSNSIFLCKLFTNLGTYIAISESEHLTTLLLNCLTIIPTSSVEHLKTYYTIIIDRLLVYVHNAAKADQFFKQAIRLGIIQIAADKTLFLNIAQTIKKALQRSTNDPRWIANGDNDIIQSSPTHIQLVLESFKEFEILTKNFISLKENKLTTSSLKKQCGALQKCVQNMIEGLKVICSPSNDIIAMFEVLLTDLHVFFYIISSPTITSSLLNTYHELYHNELSQHIMKDSLKSLEPASNSRSIPKYENDIESKLSYCFRVIVTNILLVSSKSLIIENSVKHKIFIYTNDIEKDATKALMIEIGLKALKSLIEKYELNRI